MGINIKTGLFVGTVITVALLLAFYLDGKIKERQAVAPVAE